MASVEPTLASLRASCAETSAGCWEWGKARNRAGYGAAWRAGKRISAHRLAWLLSNGPAPADKFVCHSCDNPPCCNPAHLFLGTAKDNVDDMRRKKRHRRAALFWLSEHDRVDVVSLAAFGADLSTLAKEYGVSVTAVRCGLKYAEYGWYD